MKITISKTLIAIAISIIYMIWMALITISRIAQISFSYFGNITLSCIFTIVYALIFLYLAAILKAKHQKRTIVISFIIFISLATLFSALNTARLFDNKTMMLTGIINLAFLINLVVQCFRVRDESVGTSFNILGISMLFKITAQIALPFAWGYLADYFSAKFIYLSYLQPVIDIVPMLIICSIFFHVLIGLREQENIWTKVEFNSNYEPNKID